MWSTVHKHLRFSHSDLQATFDVAHPGSGITDIYYRDESISGLSILQCQNAGSATESEDEVVDQYIREDDLVATYVQSPKRVNRKQIYLRQAGYFFGEPIAGIEIVFSMQTQRLDGDPELLIRSEFETTKMFGLANSSDPRWKQLETPSDACEYLPKDYCGAFAIELCHTDIVYVQVVDPSDFLGGRLIKLSDDTDKFILSLPVFGASLEKGVIRRGRATGFFLRKSQGLDIATRFYDWYRNSPPPLTT